jgi:hypothetical protein
MVKDILLIVPSSSFRPIPSSFVTFNKTGMILESRSLHPHSSAVKRRVGLLSLGDLVTVLRDSPRPSL